MFTGIVEARGALVRRTARGRDARLAIRGELGGEPITLGESISVDGVCVTVDAIVESSGKALTFEVDASSETFARTTLGDLAPGAVVNLERAMPLGGRMGGHIVLGHVDGVGRVVEHTPTGAALEVAFSAPAAVGRYLAAKGSVCVNGVSLTVNGVADVADGTRFDVMLIPHTLEKTSLEGLTVGTRVNIEVDVLARYVARLMEQGRDVNAEWLARLSRAGYM